ncbi:MAG TPA: thioredoxin family protein [Sphingomonadaceae bacterium]|nr:thioredoxin family protein [Sphingomonadaceae bacterium]
MHHAIVSRDEWLAARTALLAKERALTHELDALRAERRQMPWVKVTKPYVFKGSEGECTLGDLFGDRSQVALYHFMLTPGSAHICPGCSFIADHVDAARQHFEQADLAFAAVSRAPLHQIETVKARMGWAFPWVSSEGSDFNFDFGVSFTPEELAEGRAIYNYGTVIRNSPDMFGTSIFVRGEDGQIYHSYSTYHRGNELLMGALNWLDLAPKGRNEAAGTMSWVKLHDEY